MLAEKDVQTSYAFDTERGDRYARIADAPALSSVERRAAQSDATLRELFMHVHAVRCILIHTPRIAVSRDTAPVRLQPFSRIGTLANARRPTHGAASHQAVK